MSSDRDAQSRLRRTFAGSSRSARVSLRLSQRQVANAARVSRGYVAAIERGSANPTLDVVDRISQFLGLEANLILRPASIVGASAQRDIVHARCSAYVERRLRAAGWQTAREVEIVQGRSHGWMDILAFHPTTETVLVIEIKTQLIDLGEIERQLGWYGRAAGDVARRIGWRPRRIVTWLVVLASDEVERVVARNADLLGMAFPIRAREMLAWLSEGRHATTGRGLAMVDPTSRGREWLLRSRVDGRRSPARYLDYAEAARRLGQ